MLMEEMTDELKKKEIEVEKVKSLTEKSIRL